MLSLFTSAVLAVAAVAAVPGERVPSPTERNKVALPNVKLVHATRARSFHSKRWQVVAAAKSRVGSRYRWASNGPNQFDCSGLTQWAFRQAGLRLPRTSGAQARLGRRSDIHHLRPGDLVKWPGHIALYIGNRTIVEAVKPGTPVRIRRIPTWRGKSWFDKRAHGERINYKRLG